MFKRSNDKGWLVYYIILKKGAKTAKMYWVRKADNTYNIFTYKIYGTKLDYANINIKSEDRKSMIKLILSSKLNHVGK